MKRKFKMKVEIASAPKEYGEIEIEEDVIDFAKTTWMGKLGQSNSDENIMEHIAYEIFINHLNLNQILEFENLNNESIKIFKHPTISISAEEK